MSEIKITDLVDEKEIEKLKDLGKEIDNVRTIYVDAAKELAKGLKINVEGIEDLEKLNTLVATQAKKAQEATEQLTAATKKQDEIVAKTTNTISRKLTEIEKENTKKRESSVLDQKAIEIARNILGTRDQNIERLVRLNSELKGVSDQQQKLNIREKNGLASTQQLITKRQELIDRERTLKAAKSELNLILSNEEKMMQAAAGSYTQVSLQLELMKKAYKQMNDEEKNSTTGQTLAAEIQTFDLHLKELSADMGEFQRNVGNYAVNGENTRKELRQMIVEIATLTVQYRNMTEEEQKSASGQAMAQKINTLTVKAGQLKDAVNDTNRAIKAGASDTAAFDSISEGINLLVSGFGMATGAAHLLGLSEEDLVEVQTKLQSAFVISNGLIRTKSILQKESGLMTGIAVVKEKALAVATNISTAAQGKNIIVTKLASVAQAALNLVAQANPYILLATAIITVVGAFALFSAGARKSEREQKALNDELERTKNEIKRIKDNSDFNVAIAEASGESAKEIRKMRYEALAAANDLAYIQKLSVQAKYMVGNATKEQYEEAIRIEQETYDNLKKFLDEGVITEIANQKKRKEKELEAAKEAAKKRLEVIKQLKQSEIDLMDDGLKKELASIRFSYQQKIDAIAGNSQNEKRLKMNLTEQMNREISKKESEYQANREKLMAQIRMEIAEEGSKEELDAKLHLLDLEMNAEMDTAEKIGLNTALIYQKYQKRKNDVLKEYDSIQIQLIADNAAAEQAMRDSKYIQDTADLKKRYAEEIKAKGNNAKEKLEITKRYEQEEYEITKNYAFKTTRAAIHALEMELAACTYNADEQAKIREELSKLKAELAKQEVEFEIDAFEETAKAEDEASKKRKKAIKSWLEYAERAIGAIGDLIATVYDRQIEKIEEEQEINDEAYERDVERYDRQVEQGVISEEEAEARKRSAKAATEAKNEELERKKQDMAHKQAVWEKATSIAQAGIATALAITEALPNIPLSIIIGALGAIQVATILATPIPSYAEGTKGKDGHPGGAALVGDAGKREVVMYSGKAWITPNIPTLVDLPKGAQVFPDVSTLDFSFADFTTFSPSRFSSSISPRSVIINDYSKMERKIDRTNYLLQVSIKQQHQDAYNRDYEAYKSRKI